MRRTVNKSIIQLDSVSLAYGNKLVLWELSFAFPPAALVLVQGANGTGKTSLMRLFLGLLAPRGGSFEASYSRAAYVPQQHVLDRQFPLTLYNLVAMGQKPGYFLSGNGKDKKVLKALAQVSLEEHGYLHFDNASGGQLQRALLARSLLNQPDFLILDEPFAHLDSQTKRELFDFLVRKNNEEKVTICIVDHHQSQNHSNPKALSPFTHLLELKQGRAHLHS